MSEKNEKDDKPVEIFCPICGYTTYVNQLDEKYAGLARDEKIQYVKTLQHGDHPVFLCSKCDNPEQTPGIMEVR